MVEDSDSPEEEEAGEKKENDPVYPPPPPPGLGKSRSRIFWITSVLSLFFNVLNVC